MSARTDTRAADTAQTAGVLHASQTVHATGSTREAAGAFEVAR